MLRGQVEVLENVVLDCDEPEKLRRVEFLSDPDLTLGHDDVGEPPAGFVIVMQAGQVRHRRCAGGQEYGGDRVGVVGACRADHGRWPHALSSHARTLP